MKEMIGKFGSEFLRPLATLVLPGALVITSHLMLLCLVFPEFSAFLERNHADAVMAFIAASLFAGLVLEDLGSDLEVRWDEEAKRKGVPVEDNWYRYLRLAFTVEPVGHRYLRSMVMRLKFELGTYKALCVSLPAVALLFVVYDARFQWWLRAGRIEIQWSLNAGSQIFFAIILVVGALLAIYLRREAKAGHALLHKVRSELLKGIVVADELPETHGSPDLAKAAPPALSPTNVDVQGQHERVIPR